MSSGFPGFVEHEGYQLADPASAKEVQGDEKDKRIMAHCIIYAKTGEIMMKRSKKIALVMVSINIFYFYGDRIGYHLYLAPRSLHPLQLLQSIFYHLYLTPPLLYLL